jgi:predicted amidohydrolase
MLASKRKIDLLCFPECALTGYIVDHNKININDIIKDFQRYKEHQIIHIQPFWYNFVLIFGKPVFHYSLETACIDNPGQLRYY